MLPEAKLIFGVTVMSSASAMFSVSPLTKVLYGGTGVPVTQGLRPLAVECGPGLATYFKHLDVTLSTCLSALLKSGYH